MYLVHGITDHKQYYMANMRDNAYDCINLMSYEEHGWVTALDVLFTVITLVGGVGVFYWYGKVVIMTTLKSLAASEVVPRSDASSYYKIMALISLRFSVASSFKQSVIQNHMGY